ncbi:hypothetical protein P2G74_01460 [Cronobacter muytjensii]|uniref:hypothetical protein n=1 Tax=Cronobacter muytjensii TaxID=413501 RepID=UPI002DB8DE9F|nr:hypothetical protein [Cronobacter muytjensii]MEB8638640.1 hypothetical protein [Cronobacter muytjensii]
MSENLFLAAAFSALGALARLASLYLIGDQLTPKSALANLVISAFASAITLMLALRLGWQVYGISAGCGLAAWLGGDLLKVFEQLFIQRITNKK